MRAVEMNPAVIDVGSIPRMADPTAEIQGQVHAEFDARRDAGDPQHGPSCSCLVMVA